MSRLLWSVKNPSFRHFENPGHWLAASAAYKKKQRNSLTLSDSSFSLFSASFVKEQKSKALPPLFFSSSLCLRAPISKKNSFFHFLDG